MHTTFGTELPNLIGNTYGEGVCFSTVSHAPTPKRAGSQGFPVLGVPFNLCVHSLLQTKFDVVTRGEGRVSWCQQRLPSKESRVPGLPIFWSSVFMPTPFNAERPISAW